MTDSTTDRLTEAALDEWHRRAHGTWYPKADLDLSDARIRLLLDDKPARQQRRAALVSDLCERTFGQSPEAVEPLPSGTFHDAFKVSYGDRTYVLRASVGAGALPDFELHFDRLADRTLQDCRLPPLGVRAIDLSRTACDFDYEILEAARGRPLGGVDDPPSRAAIAALGRSLAALHLTAVAGFGRLDARALLREGRTAGLWTSWGDYLCLRLDEHVAIARRVGAIDGREAERITEAFGPDRIPTLERARFLHGDLGHHNVFALGDRIEKIIDWEDALAGDPVLDLAMWGTFFPDDWLSLLLEGYSAERSLPDDFEQRYWLYYLRVALVKTVHRHRFGYADRPGKPPASWRIQKALARLATL